MAEYERQTAKKCRITHLQQGNFIEKDGWDPNYIQTEVGNISRCNIIGIIVSHNSDNIVIDDGSGSITVRTFGEVDLSPFHVGDPVLVIGRPRIYNDEVYIAGEIVQDIDKEWLTYRKAEIQSLPRQEVPDEPEETTDESDEPTDTSTDTDQPDYELTEKLLERIDSLDDGDGADVDEVIEGIDGAEATINALMEEGEVFEITPGKVKVLE